LKLDLEACDEETLKNMVTYRISSTKQKTTLMQERLKDIMNIVKEKNPILMQEVYKGAQNLAVKLK
jgi:preprotein translocase subunit Sec63